MTPKWIAQGKRQPLSQLLKQGRIALELAQAHEAKLARAGWSTQDTATLADGIKDLDGATSQRIRGRIASKQATQDEEQAIDQARRFIRSVRNVLPRIVDAESQRQVLEAASRAVGRTSESVNAYLDELLPNISPLDARLAQYFEGKPPSAVLLEHKNTITRADTSQGIKRSSRSLDVLALTEAKAQVLKQVTDLSHIADNAFADEPGLANQFREPLRALRRPSKPAAKPEPETTPPTPPVEQLAEPVETPSQG